MCIFFSCTAIKDAKTSCQPFSQGPWSGCSCWPGCSGAARESSAPGQALLEEAEPQQEAADGSDPLGGQCAAALHRAGWEHGFLPHKRYWGPILPLSLFSAVFWVNSQLILMLGFFPAAAIHEKVKSVSLTSTPLFALLVHVSFISLEHYLLLNSGRLCFQYLWLKLMVYLCVLNK